jgi:hypothetical protein
VKKTGDETVDSMFDEIEIKTVQMVNGKPLISDEVQAEELDFAEACEDFIMAERKFNKIEATVRLDSSASVCEWWDCLERRYECEKRVWQLFTAGDRSPQSGKMYLQFRQTLLSGRSTRCDA